MRQKNRIGKIIRLTSEKVIDYLLDNPCLAGYSAKRDIAVLDIFRVLKKEGFQPSDEMLKIFLKNIAKSPYVPNSNKKRISKVPNGEEPPMLKAVRKKLKKLKEKT